MTLRYGESYKHCENESISLLFRSIHLYKNESGIIR